MLSILIPVYNYNITALVCEIHKQITETNIKFEIICFDDKSEKYITENKAIIDSLNYTRIILSKKNIGRTSARQILSDNSTYNWLLFLDADVMPKYDKFIKNYINKISLDYDVIFGGFAYANTKPKSDTILRWKYGKKFEEVDAEKRNLKPYRIIISANFLIKKTIFDKVNSKIERKCYGLDNYFASLLKQNNIKVSHLNNEVYHFGLESSEIYLNKVKEAIITLLWALNNDKMAKHDNKLLSVFEKFKRYKLNFLMAIFYKYFSSFIKKNLLDVNPNIYLLQFYKLLYICYKDLNKG